MMKRLEIFGKIINNEFQTSKDNETALAEFKRENNGELVKCIWVKGVPPKTSLQIRFIYLLIKEFANYLGYANQEDMKLAIKEAIGYFEIKEIKNLLTGVITHEKVYRSFVDLKKDSREIEDILRLCDEQGFAMRKKYADYMGGHNNE